MSDIKKALGNGGVLSACQACQACQSHHVPHTVASHISLQFQVEVRYLGGVYSTLGPC